MSTDDIPMAHYVKTGRCKHRVTVGLFDRADRCFAAFQMEPADVPAFLDDLVAQAEKVLLAQDLEECAGHA